MFSVAASNILKREKEGMTDLDYEEDVIDILQASEIRSLSIACFKIAIIRKSLPSLTTLGPHSQTERSSRASGRWESRGRLPP